VWLFSWQAYAKRPGAEVESAPSGLISRHRMLQRVARMGCSVSSWHLCDILTSRVAGFSSHEAPLRLRYLARCRVFLSRVTSATSSARASRGFLLMRRLCGILTSRGARFSSHGSPLRHPHLARCRVFLSRFASATSLSRALPGFLLTGRLCDIVISRVAGFSSHGAPLRHRHLARRRVFFSRGASATSSSRAVPVFPPGLATLGSIFGEVPR
jgi:hypothetical protein